MNKENKMIILEFIAKSFHIRFKREFPFIHLGGREHIYIVCAFNNVSICYRTGSNYQKMRIGNQKYTFYSHDDYYKILRKLESLAVWPSEDDDD